MREIRIVVPGRPPGANDLIRMGHWRIGKVRAEWKAIAHAAAVRAMTWREDEFVGWLVQGSPQRAEIPEGQRWPLERASVGILWRCKVRRRRDYDNLVSGVKPLLDGLVSAGIIADDSTDCLVELGPLTIEVGAGVDETVLTVRER